MKIKLIALLTFAAILISGCATSQKQVSASSTQKASTTISLQQQVTNANAAFDKYSLDNRTVLLKWDAGEAYHLTTAQKIAAKRDELEMTRDNLRDQYKAANPAKQNLWEW